MPVTTAAPAPYTAPSAIMEVVTKHRARGLPSPITSEVLARAGVSDSLIPRTLQALLALDLIDEKGAPTQTLEGLRLAPEAEFKTRMVEWLNGAYADVLNFIDPATADEVAIRDAFRSYQPVGQQPRMVTLFQGLYAAAGVIPEKQPAQRPARHPPKLPPARRTVTITRQAEPKQPAVPSPQLPAPIAGLMATLPSATEGWTKDRRDKFVTAFGTVLDLCFPIQPEEPNG